MLTEDILTGLTGLCLGECLRDAGLDADHLPGLRHGGGGAQSGVEGPRPRPGAVAGDQHHCVHSDMLPHSLLSRH